MTLDGGARRGQGARLEVGGCDLKDGSTSQRLLLKRSSVYHVERRCLETLTAAAPRNSEGDGRRRSPSDL